MTDSTTASPARPRREPHNVTVTKIDDVTPLMRRVTFSSPSLATFSPPLPASHLKLFFDTSDGAVTRTYTPLRFDSEAGELDIEFVLHGDGPAANWAANAAEGQSLTLAGPGRGYSILTDVDWYLIVVDQTALPAAATILRELPASMRAIVIVEVADPAEERELPSDADVTWVWSQRGNRAPGEVTGFLEALSSIKRPAGTGAAYAGTEAATVRTIRRHLVDALKLEPANVVTRGYWRRGVTNHPDGDYATD